MNIMKVDLKNKHPESILGQCYLKGIYVYLSECGKFYTFSYKGKSVTLCRFTPSENGINSIFKLIVE